MIQIQAYYHVVSAATCFYVLQTEEDIKRIKFNEQVAKSVASSPPPPRPWVNTVSLQVSRPSCVFTVMTYNVLSSSYANPSMYGYCQPEYLDWQVRGKNVLSEIYKYMCDVISLQEVEMEQYTDWFFPNLQIKGYSGCFIPKSRVSTMSDPKKRLVDGCAIFWKAQKFSVVDTKMISYRDLAMQNTAYSKDMLNRVCNRDNIGLLAVLKTTAAAWTHGPPVHPSDVEQLVIVANTHLHWDPKFPDVKIMQSMMMIREIISMVESLRSSFSRPDKILQFYDIKVLLCGDFNSLTNSGVFQFLSTGQLPLNHPELHGFNYFNAISNILGRECYGGITHPLKLSSACSPQIMPYTNYTYGFKAMIDYIFYSSSNLVCLGVYGPIPQEWFNMFSVVGCPHPFVPS
ncbi:hypothetical protein KQX54_007431, partial [Cotesia glomerata]